MVLRHNDRVDGLAPENVDCLQKNPYRECEEVKEEIIYTVRGREVWDAPGYGMVGRTAERSPSGPLSVGNRSAFCRSLQNHLQVLG